MNVYKGHVSNASHLPSLPGHKKLAAALAPHHARVRSAAASTGTRPVHMLTTEEVRSAYVQSEVRSAYDHHRRGAPRFCSVCFNNSAKPTKKGEMIACFLNCTSEVTQMVSMHKRNTFAFKKLEFGSRVWMGGWICVIFLRDRWRAPKGQRVGLFAVQK